MFLLGLDIGDKRIGVALGDTATQTVIPLTTLANNRGFIGQLKSLVQEHQIERLVAGQPLTLSGAEGWQSSQMKKVADKISHFLDIEIVFEDERFTSQMAADIRRTSGTAHSVDAISAVLILRSYLGHQAK